MAFILNGSTKIESDIRRTPVINGIRILERDLKKVFGDRGNVENRIGINAVMNAGAIELNGKYYLAARIEGNDRKSFFGVAESETGIDGFRFLEEPVILPDTCPEETNVYDMRLTKHEDGWIYGVFCSESKDTSASDLSSAVAE